MVHLILKQLLPRSAPTPHNAAAVDADKMSALGTRTSDRSERVDRSEQFHAYMVRREMSSTEERIIRKMMAEVCFFPLDPDVRAFLCMSSGNVD